MMRGERRDGESGNGFRKLGSVKQNHFRLGKTISSAHSWLRYTSIVIQAHFNKGTSHFQLQLQKFANKYSRAHDEVLLEDLTPRS